MWKYFQQCAALLGFCMHHYSKYTKTHGTCTVAQDGRTTRYTHWAISSGEPTLDARAARLAKAQPVTYLCGLFVKAIRQLTQSINVVVSVSAQADGHARNTGRAPNSAA